MKDEKENLDYLNEVSPEEVKDYYFVDWFDTEEVRWFRNPWCSEKTVKFITNSLDLSKVNRFRVFPYTELVLPVNEEGELQRYWEPKNPDQEFVPVCQKVEYHFDSRYQINRVVLEQASDFHHSWEDAEMVLDESTKTTLILDTTKVSTGFMPSENASENPETTHFLFDTSCETNLKKSAMEVLKREGLTNINVSTLLEYSMKYGLEVLSDDPESGWNPLFRELKEFDDFSKEMNKQSA